MKVEISARAETDLRQIQAFIAFDNIASARQVLAALRTETDRLGDQPGVGQLWEVGVLRVRSPTLRSLCMAVGTARR